MPEIWPGKAGLDLRCPIGIDKGTAVFYLTREHRLGGAIVLGDDMTDIDGLRGRWAFARGRRYPGVSVAVVGGETPDQVERRVDEFLGKLSDFMACV